jgi:Fe-S oxidoreductase
MRDVRAAAQEAGFQGNPSHGGAMHHIMEMAASPKLKQNRTGWITDDLKIRKKGEVLYFVGCLPYYEELFGKDFEFSPISIAHDTVKILNKLGIEPVVMENERCCGHDLYWLGQLDKFDELGRLNLKEFEKAGIKKIITACPECALTIKKLYPERLDQPAPEVVHISEVVAANKDKLNLKTASQKVAFQDPCRLGRFMEVYEQPRESLAAIEGIEVREMAHNRRGAVCCGTTNWMNCDATSKQIQRSRLSEAKAAGADTVVTACPKCQIHFRCAGCGEEADKIDVKVMDLVNIIASALDG